MDGASKAGGGDFWNVPLARLRADLGTGADGLSADESVVRLARFGPNAAAAYKKAPAWRQFAARFTNPLIVILLLASGLSAATGEVSSFVLVVVIILLSVVLDFVQERRAGHVIEALRRSVAVRAMVRRNGRDSEIAVEDIVPGDIVRLAAGDLIPADGRVIEAKDFFVNQALLTGEPYPVEKHPSDLEAAVANIADARNAVFLGTSVISGMAIVLVVRTGRATALGGLARAIHQEPPPTEFEIGIRRFGGLILRLTVFLVLFVLVVNVLFQRPWLESMMFALALAVGLTPELLPMIVTVTLARGAIRLAKRRVIVKRLGAMHNLGAIDTLCTDKTGTLTEAKIALVRCLDPSGAESDRLFELAYLNSHFESGIKGPLDDAILSRGPIDVSAWNKIDEVPFDFERRRVSVLCGRGQERVLVVKGAPEDMLRVSSRYIAPDGSTASLDEPTRERIIAVFERLGEDGFRVLGVASRSVGPGHASADVSDESDLVFAGFAVFVDPPKLDAAAAVKALADAGVAIVILTGDNERVTRHVCGELDIGVTGVMTGDELAQMPEDALTARLRDVDVFCRVTPQQKQRVLLALKRSGRIVGFLGDGINDASALRTADVGISVDSGADIAKEAADLILLEHELAVMRDAVMEGRRAVVNVFKYLLMGTSSNFGNMFSMAGAALILPFLPMRPIQVLLNNLLYDCTETGIPFDRVDPETMARPVRWNIRLIERFMLVIGPVSSLFDFLTFFVLLAMFRASEPLFQTGWFVESLATQTLVVFVIRTRRRTFESRPHPILTALVLGIVAIGAVLPYTPVGQWFGLVPLPALFFVFLVAASAAYLGLVEVIKTVFYRRLAGAPPG